MNKFLVMQALMPLKEDKSYLKNSFIGALLEFLLNVLLVPRWQGVKGLLYVGCCLKL